MIRADHLAGAAAVLHHHRLPQALVQLVPDQAAQNVCRAPGCGRHDHAYGPGRVVLRKSLRNRIREAQDTQ